MSDLYFQKMSALYHELVSVLDIKIEVGRKLSFVRVYIEFVEWNNKLS